MGAGGCKSLHSSRAAAAAAGHAFWEAAGRIPSPAARAAALALQLWPIKVLKVAVSFFFEVFYISSLGIFCVSLDCTYYRSGAKYSEASVAGMLGWGGLRCREQASSEMFQVPLPPPYLPPAN